MGLGARLHSRGRCTEIFVDAADVNLQGGDAFAYVCVSIYSPRGGAFGCADAAVAVASDLSSASVGPTTVLVESCGPRRCSTREVTVGAELTAIAAPNSYSRTERYEYDGCTDVFRVRGEASEASGTIVYDGNSLEAGGQIGSDQFSFSSRC